MRIICDTNVFISGVFFAGPPFEILRAWRDGRVQLVVSPAILDEYRRVGLRLANRFPGVTLEPVLHVLMVEALIATPPPLRKQVCADPDDDKFLACALATNTKIIVSGDRHLLDVSGYEGISVVRPRRFVDDCLKKSE